MRFRALARARVVAPWWRRVVAWLQGLAPISRFHVDRKGDVLTEAIVDRPGDIPTARNIVDHDHDVSNAMMRRIMFGRAHYERPAPTTMPGDGERFSQ